MVFSKIRGLRNFSISGSKGGSKGSETENFQSPRILPKEFKMHYYSLKTHSGKFSTQVLMFLGVFPLFSHFVLPCGMKKVGPP